MDDAILEAGPDAELLFVRCLSFLASVSSDGFITERQVRTIVGLGLRNITKRLAVLQEVGLIAAVDGGFVVRSWTKWNKTAEEIGKYRARDRERKAQKTGEVVPNSARNPDGIRPDSAPQSSAVQSSAVQTSPSERSATRGTRLPADFSVTPEMAQWARDRTPLVDGRRSTERFMNHFAAAPGAKGVKRDWVRTWQNWLLRDQEEAERRHGGTTWGEKKQAAALALVNRYEESEREEVGSGEAADLGGGGGQAGAQRAVGRGVG
jgi:hypothetical protein